MKKKSVFVCLLIIVFCIGFFFIGNVGVVAFNFFSPIYEGLVNLDVFSNFEIYVHSPVNSGVYNFDFGDNYTIDLNVSSNFNPSSWWYVLNDQVPVDFIPNSTFNGSFGLNELIVFADDSGGNVFNETIIFRVSLPNSAPIISPIPDELFVCEADPDGLIYYFNVTDVDEDSLDVEISPKDPFYVDFAGGINSTTFKYILFSGRLTKENAGGLYGTSKRYPEIITAADPFNTSDSKNLNITVIEVNNAPNISEIGVKTVWIIGENNTLNYNVSVLDVEDGDQDSGNLNFSVIFSGDILFNISSNGTINFTGSSEYLGVHNVSVCVEDRGITTPYENILAECDQDGGPITSCNNFSLTVTNENRAPEIVNYTPINLSLNVSGYDILYFNVSEHDPDGTIPDAYWYVDDVFKEYDKLSLVDNFAYSFGCGISGIHNVSVVVTDGELNDSVQWNVTVSEVACPPGVPAGGGGGGGASIVECIPRWACEEWAQCRNLRNSLNLGDINFDYNFLIRERCSFFDWDESICGYQSRECNDLNFCKSNVTRPGIIQECYYTENPTCDDGIKNCHDKLCEVLIDCGGPCNACPTCSDKIKNQNETEVDCGGPCPRCETPSPRVINWFMYLFVIIFIIVLIIIAKLWIKVYKTEKEVKSAYSKRKDLSSTH